MNELINTLSKDWEEELLLTNTNHLKLLFQQANQLIEEKIPNEELIRLDLELAEHDNPSLGIQVALKLAISKNLVDSIKQKTFVSVVFAVYSEHNRMLTSDQHPNGEDFLNKKLEQLNWLFGNNKHIDYELLVVDDGCPNGSGEMAIKILGENHPHARVIFLADGIKEKHPATTPLDSTNDSRKGGSIIYGMANAAELNRNGKHIIIFTDADLSTHLGQIGLLLQHLLFENKKVAIASRREVNSVVIKKGTRNTRGKLFIYLWKRLLPQLNYIIDTQCGFKAFDAELVRKIAYDMEEKKFAFDIEMLLKSVLLEPDCVKKEAIAWIDSEAESTTGGSVYLDMLHSIAGFYRKYIPDNEQADEWANFIEDLSQEKLDYLLDNMPDVIGDALPTSLGEDLIELRVLKAL